MNERTENEMRLGKYNNNAKENKNKVSATAKVTYRQKPQRHRHHNNVYCQNI